MTGHKVVKFQITAMNFLIFFVWGSWLISFGGYMGGQLGFSGTQIGSIFGAMGIVSLFMPALMGIVADRWINAERLLGISQIIVGVTAILAARATSYSVLYPVMFIHLAFFMPCIALGNTISYSIMGRHGMDIEKEFPPIRVWGTVGFIIAMWIVDLFGWVQTPNQLYLSAGAAFILAIYAFTMPQCKPQAKKHAAGQKRSWLELLGLDAIVLFKQKQMALFFLFAMLLGACLQITNTFGNPFLQSFSGSYADSFAVKHPNVLLSLSQISETLFILAIPFFLKRFGIKVVMLISMLAWVLRFFFFGIGNPGDGFIFLILSMIVYGMAFDFFNISGSIFVDQTTSPEMRGSAQGLFMLMTNGLGAIIGSYGSGMIVDLFTHNKVTDWSTVWFVFAVYALVISILFALLFRYKKSAKVAD